MDDDIDFDDLLGEERDDYTPPTIPSIDPSNVPSANEIRLAKRVQELEAERDALNSELASLRSSTFPQPVPIPAVTITSDSNDPTPSATQITIPHDILPILALLRSHIAELSRDNAALRYTFIGGRNGLSGNDKAVEGGGELGDPGGGTADVDLEEVVKRVKELIKENEELGEMVLRLGRTGATEWQKALDESRVVIESLDSDLSRHLETIESLRSELDEAKAKAKSATITAPKSQTPARAPTQPPRGPSSISGPTHGLGRPPIHRPMPTPVIQNNQYLARPIVAAPTAVPLTGLAGLTGSRERDKRRERDRDSQGSSGGQPRDAAGGGGRGGNGVGASGSGVGVKAPPRGPRDDRDTKRRR